MSRVPEAQRLEAARRVARLLLDRSFRESIAALQSGDKHLIVASPDDPMSYVIEQIEHEGMPVTLAVYEGSSSLVFVTIQESTDGDDEECGEPFPLTPETHVGMLVACMWERKRVRFDIQHGARSGHLEFAFA